MLYDVTSSYLEGRRCELAQFGLSRDHRSDRPQIVFGLLCTPEGCPVAVEVFEGNLGDPSTLADQVRKLRTRFRLKRIVLVGDRGMITQARIDADLTPAGFDWITALRAPAIKALAAEGGPLHPRCSTSATWRRSSRKTIPANASSFAATRTRGRADAQARRAARGERDCAHQDPRNDRAKTQSAPRQGQDRPQGRRRHRSPPHGQALRPRHHRDGPVMVAQDRGDRRGSRPRRRLCDPKLLPGDGFPAAAVVLAYKGLSHAERGFRDIKSGDLDVRPIHHRRAHRVRAHVFLCMLAYYVIWHMKRDLAPMLFKDDDPAAAAEQRSSPVATAKVSPAARRKAVRKRTEDGRPVHSFRTLLQDLANLTRNSVRFGDARPTTVLSRPTPTHTPPSISSVSRSPRRQNAPARARQGPAEGAATAGQADPGHDRGAGVAPPPSWRRRASSARRPPPTRWAPCSAPGLFDPGSTRTNSTPPSTFWAPTRARSRRSSPAPPEDGVLVLYDVTSSYLEGRRCELAQFGFSRDHRERPAADRLRPLVHAGGLSGRRRGVRGQSRRSEHVGRPGQQAPHALSASSASCSSAIAA